MLVGDEHLTIFDWKMISRLIQIFVKSASNGDDFRNATEDIGATVKRKWIEISEL